MNKREALLRRISALQFAVWEMHLYLDTHDYDTAIMAKQQESKSKLDAAVKEFEQAYGPLTHSTQNGNGKEWLEGPWPWDYDFEEGK